MAKSERLDIEQLRKQVHTLLRAMSPERRSRLRQHFAIANEPRSDGDALRELTQNLIRQKNKKKR